MNRQKVIITFILLLAFLYAKGQDKIITMQKDTIFCKIISISLKVIQYEQTDYDQITVINSIPMKQVQEYSLGFRSQGPSSGKVIKGQVTKPFVPPATVEEVIKPSAPPVTGQQVAQPATREEVIKPSAPPVTGQEVAKPSAPSSTVEEVITPSASPATGRQVTTPFSPRELFADSVIEKQPAEPFQRWRIGFQVGGGYLLNSLADLRQAMKDAGVTLPNEINNYYYPLRRGVSFDANIHYWITGPCGLGLKYSFFTSSNQMDYSVQDEQTDFPIYYVVNEKESFYLNYIGPSILFRQWLGKNRRFSLNEEISIGYMFFRDKKQFDPNQYVFVNPETNEKLYNILKEGKALSGTFQLSLDYYPASWISIGVNAGIFPTLFRTLKISDNTSPEKKIDEDSHLDLSRLDYSIGMRFHF